MCWILMSLVCEVVEGNWLATYCYGRDANSCPCVTGPGTPQLQSWPVYKNSSGQNYVFDANVTSLGYAEPDTWRAEAINYFAENFVELFAR